jgi:hypothetical protein
MKKTTKPNPLKTFNDNKAMAYKKVGGSMKAFKKSLPKGQNGIAVDSGMDSTSKMPAPTGKSPGYVKIKEGVYAKGNPGNDTTSPRPKKPMTPKVNYRDEIQKKYGTGPGGQLTPEDMMKLKARGILKKGGTVKRKK